MLKNNNFVLIISLTLILSFTQVFHPTTLSVNALGEKTDANIQLYKTTEVIELENKFILQEGTYLYGMPQGKIVNIQFANSYISIPISVLEEVNGVYGNLPEYHEIEHEPFIKSIPKDILLFSLDSDKDAQIITKSEIEYPISKNNWEMNVLYIGNIEYYLSKEDQEIVLKAIEDELIENSIQNGAIEGNSSTKDAKDRTSIDKDINTEEAFDNRNTQFKQQGIRAGTQSTEEGEKEVEETKETSEDYLSLWNKTPSKYFVVMTDNLEVYDNRTGKLVKIGNLKKGQIYPRVRDYGAWHRIQFGDIYGYVRKADTAPVPEDKANIANISNKYKNGSRIFKASDNVVIYDNSSGSLVPFGVIDKGQNYPIVSDYGNWWRVIFADRVGYVSKKQVEVQFAKSDKYFKTVTNLPVYDNRTGRLVKIGELPSGQVYPRVSDYGSWHRIQFGNIYGYVHKSGTTLAAGNEIKNINKNYTPQSRTFRTLETITVYDNSSGKLVPFGTIEQGHSFPIVSDYGNWWRVIFSDRVGYVSKKQVEVQFAKSDKYFKTLTNLPVYDNRTGKLKKIGELPSGQVYPRVSDYGSWHRIQFGNIYGYVHISGTTLATGNEIKNINKNYTPQSRTFKTLETVTVYDNSSGKLVPFGSIEKGVTEFSITSDYGNWWRIIYADRVGYISKNEVQVSVKSTDKYFRAIKNTSVYDNRTGSLVKVGEIIKGQSYPIVSDYGNWWRVQFGNLYGYVRKSDTGYANQNEINNLNKTYKNSRNNFLTNKKVTVYDNSSGKLIPFGQLEKDQFYPIVSDYGNWWRIIYLDRVGYVRKNEVTDGKSYINYNITLEEAVKMQMKVNPQTDKKEYAYVFKDFIKNNKVTVDTLYVRSQPKMGDNIIGTLSKETEVTIVDEINGWYAIEFKNNTWVHAITKDVLYYLSPNQFVNDPIRKFQFLDLNRPSSATAKQLDNLLIGKGTLAGQGQSFYNAGKKYRLNEIYLISHALLETGHGTSILASGNIEVGIISENKYFLQFNEKDSKGKDKKTYYIAEYKQVKENGNLVWKWFISETNSSTRNSAKSIRKTYNMFGIGAYDSNPAVLGAIRAYNEKWDTPAKAIEGGAKFIGERYVLIGQNTLYKMRWNPEAMVSVGKATHQYATDIGWAYKQSKIIHDFYEIIGLNTYYFEIPIYKK